MDSTSESQSAGRPRPFVSGRPPARPAPVSASNLPRPFPFVNRTSSRAGVAAQPMALAQSDSSRWSVAVYEPGLEHVDDAQGLDGRAPSLDLSPEPLELPAPAVDDMAEMSLVLAESVREAGRHANSLAAAEVLDSVAHRLRSGQILLPAGTPPRHEAAVFAAVLAALLGESR